MQSHAQRLISPFRTIVLAGVAALLITSAALPMPAQTSVPATAVQAARTPEFASRLAHPVSRPASRPNPALARQGSRSGPPEGPIYDNGPINGNSYAWAIDFGFVVSDTFTVGAGSVNGMTFGAWLLPGDTLISAELSITSQPNGGTSYFDQTVTLSQGTCTTNGFGYDVCPFSASFNGPTLNAGTYWVNLQNASGSGSGQVYWDENSGVGCTSSGCPSQAWENTVGTIPSESFTMQGSSGSPACFQSQGKLQIIHDFTQQQGGQYGEEGVTIDRAGNLYGTNPYAGDHSAGFVYKLTHFAGWVFNPLFSFFGGNNGGQPTGVTVGPNGGLYGGAGGGIQNCGTDGSQYCGLVFNLTPQPTACRTALCGWTENVPYRFSGESDGSGVINVSASDQEGNLYGTTSTGGTYDGGTVFELTPSGGGWTKTTLYSFTGGNDGSSPTQVLVGNDGNLYGVATGGNGVVFQLMSSGGQWTESVLHAFSGYLADGADPGFLVQDSAGNLYGIVTVFEAGAMFVLQKSSGWAFDENVVWHTCLPQDLPYGNLNNLTIDAAGNLYGTGTGGEEYASSGRKSPGGSECFYNYIFKASYDSGGWHYQDLNFLLNTYFSMSGSLAVDTSGNLYGTTSGCGTYNSGTVWQRSP